MVVAGFVVVFKDVLGLLTAFLVIPISALNALEAGFGLVPLLVGEECPAFCSVIAVAAVISKGGSSLGLLPGLSDSCKSRTRAIGLRGRCAAVRDPVLGRILGFRNPDIGLERSWSGALVGVTGSAINQVDKVCSTRCLEVDVSHLGNSF